MRAIATDGVAWSVYASLAVRLFVGYDRQAYRNVRPSVSSRTAET